MANISKLSRNRMLLFIEQLKSQHTDDESLIAINEIEKAITNKKYGLVWEEHSEELDLKLHDMIPVFTEVVDKRIENKGDKSNFILEGDNLHSLLLLEKTHKGKIDVIYIDPPYNTGSRDFIYDDSFVDKQDGYRHSKWISFMNRRLQIAKKLLSKDGVIFISIDDNEEAALKLLCDEIFGEICFVGNISWQRTYSPRNDSQGLSSEVEHILVYSKSIEWMPQKLPRTEKMDEIYKSPDGDEKPWTSSSLTAPSASSHQGMVYAIQHPFTGELMYPTAGRCWALGQDQMLENMQKWANYKYEIIDDDAKRAEICGVDIDSLKKEIPAIILDEELDEARKKAETILENGNWPYFYFTNNGKGGIRRKTYLSDMSGRMPTNYWPFSEVGHTDGAKKELKDIFVGKIPFDTPKPTSLIKRILQIASKPDSVILDFFAGSGTTGQAVLEFNKEDGGKRHFILCTNNEANICENVTYQRVKTVITGKRTDGSEFSDGCKTNLLYYRTDFIKKEDEDIVDLLTNKVEEMIQLYSGHILNEKQIIVLSDEEMDCLEKDLDEGRFFEGIYISSDILLTSNQERLLQSQNVYIIPECFFENELREIGEIW